MSQQPKPNTDVEHHTVCLITFFFSRSVLLLYASEKPHKKLQDYSLMYDEKPLKTV